MKILNLNYRLFPILAIFLTSCFAFNTATAEQNIGSEIVQRTRELMTVTEELRGLDFVHDLPVEFVSQDRMVDIITEQLAMQISPEIDRNYSAMYVLLGLMPRGSSIIGNYQSMVEEQVAGLYDPHDKKFYVVDVDYGEMIGQMFGQSDALGSVLGGFLSGMMEGLIGDKMQAMMQDTVIVHELTHAIDDQYFDLESKMDELLSGNSDDAQLAYQSLVEGNAVRIQNEYTMNLMELDPSFMDQYSELSEMLTDTVMNYDPFLERIMIVPYLQGETFVRYIMNFEGENGINDAFANPPVSMEQILHPERYITNPDTPSAISALPDLSGVLTGWNLEATDTLGELITGLVFEIPTGNRALGERVALGWDYDVVTTWRSPSDDLAMVWTTVWDSTDDATEFFDAYCELLEVKYPPGEWQIRHDVYGLYTGEGLAAVIQQDGKVVVLVEGVPDSKADQCLSAAWPANVYYR